MMPSTDASRLVKLTGNPAVHGVLLTVLTLGIFAFTLDFERSFDDRVFFPESSERQPDISLGRVLLSDYWAVAAAPTGAMNSPYYRPLSQAVIVLERSVFGDRIALIRGFHTLLHFLNILLVYIAAAHLLKNEGLSKERVRRAAFIAAAWFALSPLTADTVLFLASVCDLLALLFSLSSAVFFVRYLHAPGPARLVPAVLSCAAAQAAKETGFAVPLMFVAMAVFQSFTASRKQKAIGIVAASAVTLAMLAVRFAVLGTRTGVGVIAYLAKLPALLTSALRYTVIPHPMQLEIEVGAPSSLETAASIAGLLIIVFLGYHFRKAVRLSSFGIVSWALFLLPAMSAAVSQGVFAPRYLYLPFAFAAMSAAPYLATKGKGAAIRSLLLGCVAMLLFVLSVSRAMTWKDSLTLWAVEIGLNPKSLTAEVNLSGILAERGRFSEAMVFSDRAYATGIERHRPCAAATALINGAAILAERLDQPNEALVRLKKAAALCPSLANEAADRAAALRPSPVDQTIH